LIAGPIFALAASLADVPPDLLPGLLRDRLNEGERALLERAASPDAATASAVGCVNALKCLRYDRERAAVQEEIDRLQEQPAPESDGDRTLVALWEHKKELLRKIEELNA